MRTPFWFFRSILVPSLPQPRHAKHIYRCTPPTPPTHTRALSPGQKIAVFQPNPICGCCMVLWSFGHARATMLRLGMRICSIFNSQHIATGWPNACNMLRPTMLRYIALNCYDRLAGARKCWASNVGKYCVEMLRSFGRWGEQWLCTFVIILGTFLWSPLQTTTWIDQFLR